MYFPMLYEMTWEMHQSQPGAGFGAFLPSSLMAYVWEAPIGTGGTGFDVCIDVCLWFGVHDVSDYMYIHLCSRIASGFTAIDRFCVL